MQIVFNVKTPQSKFGYHNDITMTSLLPGTK